MILYVSVLRQGIPSDDSLRFLLDSFVLMPFPTSARIVYMLCEQIVIEPLFLRFLQLYLHRRYRSIQKAPGFRRAQMGFMHKTGSAEGVKGATADIRLFSLSPCRLRRGEIPAQCCQSIQNQCSGYTFSPSAPAMLIVFVSKSPSASSAAQNVPPFANTSMTPRSRITRIGSLTSRCASAAS